MTSGNSLQTLLKSTRTKKELQRTLCVWLKEALSLNSTQIGAALGLAPASVRRIQAEFARRGVESIFTKQHGGRRRENMSLAREAEILSKFGRQARRGASLDVREIQRAYELSAGKEVSRWTIYRLIARHGLRRYLPRARRIAGLPGNSRKRSA